MGRAGDVGWCYKYIFFTRIRGIQRPAIDRVCGLFAPPCLRVKKKNNEWSAGCVVRAIIATAKNTKKKKKKRKTQLGLVVLHTSSINAISRFHTDSCILKSSDTNNSWFSGILQTWNTEPRDPRFSWCTMAENSCPVLYAN